MRYKISFREFGVLFIAIAIVVGLSLIDVGKIENRKTTVTKSLAATFDESLLPGTTGYDLGRSTQYWRSLYLNNFRIGDTNGDGVSDPGEEGTIFQPANFGGPATPRGNLTLGMPTPTGPTEEKSCDQVCSVHTGLCRGAIQFGTSPGPDADGDGNPDYYTVGGNFVSCTAIITAAGPVAVSGFCFCQ